MYYADKVYIGIDDQTTKSIGWLLPKKQISYSTLLDSTLLNPTLINHDTNRLFVQYYLLRHILKEYREIEKSGSAHVISISKEFKSLKPGDTSYVIIQIKHKLKELGDLNHMNDNNIYDADLVGAIKIFKQRQGYKPDSLIRKKDIEIMNNSNW